MAAKAGLPPATAPQNASWPTPAGETTPIPVIITRRIFTSLLSWTASHPPENDARAMSAERKRIAQDNAGVQIAGRVGNIIQVAIRVRIAIINGWRNGFGFEREHARSGLDRAGGAHGVSDHALDGAYGRGE